MTATAATKVQAMMAQGGEITERLLRDAGVGPAMRVLDIGCGHGDVSILAARAVGERGFVLGVDRAPQPLAAAAERARQEGLAQVTFRQGEFGDFSAEFGPFDAAIGRRVLMYQPDAVEAVRRLARSVRPGGLVIFQEHDATGLPQSRPEMPLHERVHGWMWRTVEREGGNRHMGFDLARVLTEAGLVVAQVRVEAVVQSATEDHPTALIVRAMLPRIVEHGVATADEIDVDTLEPRLAAERARPGAVFLSELVFGVWARRPG